MNRKRSIQYANFLRDPHSLRGLADMVEALKLYEMSHESHLLQEYISNGASLKNENPWTSGKLFIGQLPPLSPNAEDVWFDPLELMPHLFLSDPDEEFETGWYPIHPVTVWQYVGFLHNFLPQFSTIPKGMDGKPIDLFSMPRFAHQPEENAVVDLYYFEARSYATFFGKHLVGENILAVEAIKHKALTKSMAPDGLNLWDSIGYMREDDPTAFNLNTAKYEFHEDLGSIDYPNESKVIYEEWEKSNHTGFACFMGEDGPFITPNGRIYPYIQSSNPVKRMLEEYK